jgi:F0F1-type ATP synthase delta subunit
MIDSAETEKHHQHAIDVGAQQLGGIYAKALLAATEKGGKTAAIVEELDSLVDVLDQFPALDFLK